MNNRFLDDSLKYLTIIKRSKSKGLDADQKRIQKESGSQDMLSKAPKQKQGVK